MRLIRLRVAANMPEENAWAFGQVFPVVLLIAPVVTLVGGFWPSKKKTLPVSTGTDLTDYGLRSREYANQHTQAQTHSATPGTPNAQVVNQQINEDYESSASFRGASVLASFTYLNMAIFILASDKGSPSIVYVAGAQLWSSAFLQPLYQTSWPLYVIWIPKLKQGEPRTSAILDFIFLVIFLVNNSLPSYQITMEVTGWSELIRTGGTDETYNAGYWATSPHLVITTEMWGVISLLLAYLTFVGWFTLNSRVRFMKSTRRCWNKDLYLVLVSLGSISCSGLTLVPFLVSDFLFGYLVWNSGYAFGSLLLFACQLLVGLVAFATQNSRGYAIAIRTSFLAFIMALILAVLYYYYYLIYATHTDISRFGFEIPMGTRWLIPVVVACQAWFIIWVCTDIMPLLINRWRLKQPTIG